MKNDDKTFHCLIVGSRNFNDYNLLKIKTITALKKYIKEGYDIEIVSGGAKGADFLASKLAIDYKFRYKEFPADWNKYGKQAGYIRNKEMHEYIANFPNRGVLAFWNGESKGTQHSFELAADYNNQIRIIRYSNNYFS